MPRDARAEAEAEFDNVAVPRDFDQVELPFRERGDARLIRSDGDGVVVGREEPGGADPA
jgi:hypothetical protein